MGYRGQLDGFENKGVIDLVTAADRASEALIVNAVRARFPDDAILAEESGSDQGSSGYEWIVDPLDGTTNFVHGFDVFMVSIGVRRAGQRTIGACYGPVNDELFSAVAGYGATCNGQSIQVGGVEQLSQALVATGFPYNRRDIVDSLLERVKRALLTTHGVRRAGSAAYDQCWVASGRLDGFFEQGLSPWDMAAGTLIVEEAGGTLQTYDGSRFDLFGSSIVCGNPTLAAALAKVVGDR